MTPGILPVVVLGALLGLALLQLRWVLFPPSPDLVAEIEAWRRGRDRAGLRAGTPTPASPLGRLTRWVNETLRARRPEFLDTLAPDLAVTGRDLQAWLGKVVTLALVFGLGPTVLMLARRTRDAEVSLQWGPVIGAILAVAAVVLSVRDLRTEATRARQRFTESLSLYLDLVAMSMEAGNGHAQALPAVAQIGGDATFRDLRTAIELAPSKGITPWEALGQLGVRYAIPELVSLRSTIELAQDDGARIKESLIARAETMRAARLAADLERANKATESMKQLNLIAAMLAAFYIAGPYILALRTAAGAPGSPHDPHRGLDPSTDHSRGKEEAHMIRIYLLTLTLAARITATTSRQRDERGEGAVPWLIVLGAGIAIAYFAGDAVMAFAKGLVGNLGKNN